VRYHPVGHWQCHGAEERHPYHHMKKILAVVQCYHGCPFFEVEGSVMMCGHPFWDGKGAYAGAIIDHRNSSGRVPDRCPLRVEPAVITCTLDVHPGSR
jgi:hypothetical protein